MCQGSNCKLCIALVNIQYIFLCRKKEEKELTNIIEATRYNPSVAASEITIFLKIWLLKSEPALSDPD